MSLKLSKSVSILLLMSFNLFGGTIKGIVTDSRTGEPLSGATVVIEGTNMGVSTGNGGVYVIENVPPGNYIITASFIVYGNRRDSISVKKQN